MHRNARAHARRQTVIGGARPPGSCSSTGFAPLKDGLFVRVGYGTRPRRRSEVRRPMPPCSIGARCVMWEAMVVVAKVPAAPQAGWRGMTILCDIRFPRADADRLERDLRSLLLAPAFAAALIPAFAAAFAAAVVAARVRRDQAPVNFPAGADDDGQGMFVGLERE